MMVLYRVRGFSTRDVAQIDRILQDRRGWAGLGWSFRRVEDEDIAEDVLITLRDRTYMEARFKRPDLQGLSVTTRHKDGRSDICIASDRWRHVPKDFVGSKGRYRAYLIQHEMGHALGHGHEDPIAGQRCPVMYQQTRGTRGICLSNPWQ